MIKWLKKIIYRRNVPSGAYCYKIINIDKSNNNTVINTKVCPYYERLNVEDGYDGYCHLLEEGNDILLDDQVKICGIKDYPIKK